MSATRGVSGRLCLAVAGSLACGDGDASAGDSTTTGGGSSSPTESGSDGATTTSEPGSGDTGTHTNTLCGNGELDEDEVCDDGNADPNDGCEPDCSYTPGHLLWQVSFDGPAGAIDYGSGIAFDDQGNIFVSGGVQTEDEGRDAWIGKLDPEGGEIWTLTHRGPGGAIDHASRVAAGPAGGVMAAGYVTVEERPGDEPDDFDIWIGSYDGDGNELWTTTVAGAAAEGDFARDIAVADDGTIFVVGSIEDVLDQVDMWIAAYDEDGNELWSETIDRVSWDAIGGVGIDQDGNVIVAGYGVEDASPYGVWLREYDPDGNEQWTVDYAGEALGSYARGLAITPDDGIVITGIGRAPGGGYAMATRKFDAAGQEVWGAYYDKQGPFGALDVAADADGHVFVAGIVGIQDRSDDVYLGHFDADGERVWSRFHDGPASLGDVGEGVGVAPDGFPIVIGHETVLGEGSNIWIAKYVP